MKREKGMGVSRSVGSGGRREAAAAGIGQVTSCALNCFRTHHHHARAAGEQPPKLLALLLEGLVSAQFFLLYII